MAAIFYDLETSDTAPIGQILNYSFILVNDRFEILSEESGGIALSRLQLPSPGAVLANRTKVFAHNAQYKLPEHLALKEIVQFISNASSSYSQSKLPLVGFNSSKFDLTHLRTAFIRNGINPYFGGRVVYRDLLHLSRWLYMFDDRFPQPQTQDSDGKPKLSLRLEDLTNEFGLLTGQQTHQSRDDVVLTIQYAKLLAQKFEINICAWESYRAAQLHNNARKEQVFYSSRPNYEVEEGSRVTWTPVTLLDYDNYGALWVDLLRFQEGQGRDAVRWLSTAKEYFYAGERGQTEFTAPQGEQFLSAARAAQEQLKELTTKNFFERSKCDIEADIFRLDFDDIRALERAIWNDDTSAVIGKERSHDRKTLWARYRLKEYQALAGKDHQKFQEMLKSYALYRYGGLANLSKRIPLERYEEGQDPHGFHKNLNELLGELRNYTDLGQDPEILRELREYYEASDIWQLAGAELLNIPARTLLPLEVGRDSS